MTIDIQSAAPQGAAPTSIPAGPGARSGDAPTPTVSFASLMTQLSGSAPAGRSRPARPATPAAPAAEPGDGAPAAAGPEVASGSPTPSDGPVALGPATPPEASTKGETGSAPVDATALVPPVAPDPLTVVPVWLWALNGPATPPAADASASATSGSSDGASAGAALTPATTFANGPSIQSLAPAPGGVFAPSSLPAPTASPVAEDASGDQPVPPVAGATYTPVPVVDAADAAPVEAGVSGRFGSATAGGRNPLGTANNDRLNKSGAPVGPLPPATTGATGAPGQTESLAAGSAATQAAVPAGTPVDVKAPDLPASPRPVDRFVLSSATRPATPVSSSSPAATTGQPAPLADAAAPALAQSPIAEAVPAQATAPGRYAPTSFIDRTAAGAASRPGPALAAPAPTVTNGPVTAPASASDNRQSSSDRGSSDRAAQEAAQTLASRAVDASAAAPFLFEHGGTAATRLVEAFGAGSSQAAGAASMSGLASAAAAAAIPDEADLRRQIVQGIKIQWRDGGGDIKLLLNPKYLGEMSIALRVEQGGVTAQLSADSASVRVWAMANESLLRQGLAEQGLTLSRLVVTEKAQESMPEREGRRRAPQQETPEPPAPRQSETATFEIVL